MTATIFKASASIGAIEAVNQIPTTGNNTFDLVKLGIQLVIGIFSFLSIRKQNRINKENNQNK